MVKILIYVVLAIVLAVGCQTWRNSGNVAVPSKAPASLRIASYNVHYIILSRETGD